MFVGPLAHLARRNIKRTQALGAGNDDLSGTIERDPDRRDIALARHGTLRRLAHQFPHSAQQVRDGVVALLEKGISQKAVRHVVRNVLAAQCDGGNLGKAVPHHGKKFEARHIGHAQIGNNKGQAVFIQAMKPSKPSAAVRTS